MSTCTIETGFLRKHPCGHPGIAICLNCEQHLCLEHAVPVLNEAGNKTGKSMCKECSIAAKEHEKQKSAVAKSMEAKKLSDLAKAAREQAAAPPAPIKKPAPAAAPHAPEQPAAAEHSKEPEALEFTPKDGKLEYTKKKD